MGSLIAQDNTSSVSQSGTTTNEYYVHKPNMSREASEEETKKRGKGRLEEGKKWMKDVKTPIFGHMRNTHSAGVIKRKKSLTGRDEW